MTSGPTGSVILSVYEQGMTASPAVRAGLLARAGGSQPDAMLGDADRAAWSFLQDQFGAAQDAVLTCSACGEDVEFDLPDTFGPPSAAPNATVSFEHDDTGFVVRLPRLSDMRDGRFDPHVLCPEGDWTDATFRSACERALLAEDPALRIDLNLVCASCGEKQTHVFDVSGFVWRRLEQAARALVRDVAKLARGYGWSEAEITAMTAARRAIYLRELSE
ncbi:MAG: hypothetical protein AAF665_15595 [Pseudomonadota bacterium]